MSTQLGHELANFFVWRASDDFAIHVSLNLVSQLNTQISRAGSDGQPGELRGLLLGRTIHEPFRATLIEDFELICPPEYATASQPDSDEKVFEIACRMAKDKNRDRALGFFISGWDGSLNMSRHELETFGRIFGEDGNIALLIQTSRRGNVSDAALFYWQHGEAHPRDFGFGFPFEAGQLMNRHPGWRYPNPIEPERITAPLLRPEPHVPEWNTVPQPEEAWADLHIPAPAVASKGGSRIRWSHLAPTIALAVIGIGGLQLATSSKHTVAAAPAPAIARSTAPGPAPAPVESATPAPAATEPLAPPSQTNDTGLGLSVAFRPQQLDIRWNQQSSAITQAESGIMKIKEAGSTRVIPFDHQQLLDGHLAYLTKNNDVSVKLEVTGKNGGTTSESVRSLALP